MKTNSMFIEEKVEVYNLENTFNDFKDMLVSYANANGKKLDLDILRTALKITMFDKIHSVLFMGYILEYWYAYTIDVINGKYTYINFTPMVYDSFLEHMAH